MARFSHITRLPWMHIGLGLAIRESLAPWTGHPYDFEIWTRLGFYMQNLINPYGKLAYVPGVSFAPYGTVGSISYPPLSAFIFAITFRIYSLLGEPSRFLYYFLLKQPIVFTDTGAAIVLGKIIMLSGDAISARRAFLIWIYFPFSIIISAVWGQLDPMALILILLAIYFGLTNKWMTSAFMLGFSIYLKTLPLVFLPVILMKAPTLGKVRIGYSFVALSIPFLGTLVPAFVLNWGFQGMYNNFSFQVAIPWDGAMSALNIIYLVLNLPTPAHYIIGALWIPVLAAAYVYIWKRNLGLVQGLILAILVFSISRPFLPEQWSLYPLAFLLLIRTQEDVRHFFGMAVTATAFLVANNTLLIRFLSPVSVDAFNWDIFTNNLSAYVDLRIAVMALLSLLYFIEALLVLLGRESLVYRAIVLAKSSFSIRDQLVLLR